MSMFSLFSKLERWQMKRKCPRVPDEITISSALDVMERWGIEGDLK